MHKQLNQKCITTEKLTESKKGRTPANGYDSYNLYSLYNLFSLYLLYNLF